MKVDLTLMGLGLDNGQGKKLGIIKRLTGGTTTGATSGRVNPPVEKDEFYYHGDHLGSSNMITDAYGAVYQHLEYFPYGETWIEEGGSYGGNTPGYKFTGKELDPETGLYYYGARYYDPVLSRWISADPILDKYLINLLDEKRLKQLKEDWVPEVDLPGLGGVFRSANLNLFGFSHNNPIVRTDPDGNAVFENSEKLTQTGTAAIQTKELKPKTITTKDKNGNEVKHLQTYCSGGVRQIEEQGGNKDYKGLTANEIISKLEDPNYGTKITPEQAVEYAKQGATVIAGAKSTGAGHVAVVSPKDLVYSGSLKKNVPNVFNVGKTMGLKPASQGFNVKNQPEYFIRNLDKTAVDKKTGSGENP